VVTVNAVVVVVPNGTSAGGALTVIVRRALTAGVVFDGVGAGLAGAFDVGAVVGVVAGLVGSGALLVGGAVVGGTVVGAVVGALVGSGALLVGGTVVGALVGTVVGVVVGTVAGVVVLAPGLGLFGATAFRAAAASMRPYP
jgi:hypothetical protein